MSFCPQAPNKSLQVTFDPLPIFAAAKPAAGQMHLNSGVMHKEFCL